MGGIVVKIVNDGKVNKFNAQSLDVANLLNINSIEYLEDIEHGDDHNGTIIFDVDNKVLYINSDYFKFEENAKIFWQLLGFKIILNKRKYSDDNDKDCKFNPDSFNLTISGEAAEKFLEDINKPPTEEQKAIQKEAEYVYKTIKRK